MRLKKFFTLIFVSIFIQHAYADQSINLYSPDGRIQLGLNCRDNGDLVYSVAYKGKGVIQPSGLGFKLNVPDLALIKFSVVSADSSRTDETWKPVWGEQSSIRNNYKQFILRLSDKSGSDISINIVFQVFNDGIGFR
jgi:hypothetical protein